MCAVSRFGFFQVASSTASQIDLTWTAATQDQYENPATLSGSNGNTAAANIIGYNVYRSTDGKTFSKINSSLVTGTTYSDTTGTVGQAPGRD